MHRNIVWAIIVWAIGASFLSLHLAACGHAKSTKSPKASSPVPAPLGERSPRAVERPMVEPEPPPAVPTALVGGTLLLGNGRRISDGILVWTEGRIAAVGTTTTVSIPQEARIIDVRGQFVTPGLIDTHSHLGVYASPSIDATADGNEMTDPTTPYVFSEHSIWPQDPGFERALRGGVTTIQVLPGSGNVIGGRSVVLKLRPQREARAMRFWDAPNGLKMACGENPKRVYGGSGKAPMSRMGSISKMRAAFVKAQEYRYNWRAYRMEMDEWTKKYEAYASGKSKRSPGKEPRSPDRDLGLETLSDALDGKIQVHVHCYRADEMLLVLALAREFGFKVASFHHAVEAYKIADVLAREEVSASVWSDWWGFKLEAYDAIEENAAIVAAIGGRAIIHSDSAIGIQRLHQDTSKALYAGIRAGLSLTEDDALSWITKNPAWALGILHRTGTLEVGKDADVVVWDRTPFSIYARARQVYVEGALLHDAQDLGEESPWSDFEVKDPSSSGKRP